MLHSCGDTWIMSQATLTLSPHELYFLPPGTPATSQATRVEVEVDGKIRAFLARSEIYIVPNRKHHSIFLFFKEETADAALIGLESFSLQTPRAQTENQIADSVKSLVRYNRIPRNRYWRSPSGAFGVVFNSRGRASVQSGDGNNSLGRVPFRWDEHGDKGEFCSWNAPEFLEFCARVAEDEHSPLQYALTWRNFSEEQKNAIAFGCDYGDWETMRHYFLLAAKIITHHFGAFPLPESELTKWKIDLPWPSEEVPRALSWSSRWRAAISQIFRPSFQGDEPICISEWRTRTNVARCAVKCTVPTHHELVEAQLELREWLRPHLPAAEIEELMRPE